MQQAEGETDNITNGDVIGLLPNVLVGRQRAEKEEDALHQLMSAGDV